MRADVLLMLILAVAAGAALPLIAWRRALARVRELEARLLPQRGDDARLEQLQRAVEALASHSDQLTEGQDFLVRLLSERLPGSRLELGAPRPEITPH